MALAVSYPGVYVQAIIQPSPPDSGVATSLAAFIGRAPMGPVNKPVLLNSWGDYQRFFGGLDEDSSMSYQVSAFFNNGGGQAAAVRLFEPSATDAEISLEVTNQLALAETAIKKVYTATVSAAPAAADAATGADGDATGGAAAGAGGGTAAPVADAPTPTSAQVNTAVTGVFTAQTALGGVSALVAGLLQPGWATAAAALPATPTQPQSLAALGTLVDGTYTYGASLSLNPLNPIDLAVNDLLEALELQALVNASPEQLNLVMAGLIGDFSNQPVVASALKALQPAVAGADNANDAITAVGVALPAAYVAAVPVLGQTSDPVYGPAATVAAGATPALTKLSAAASEGTIQTAIATQQQAAAGATPAALKTAVAAYVTANYATDAGAAALNTSIQAAKDVPTAVAAANTAVTALISTAPTAIQSSVSATVAAQATTPADDLTVAFAQGMMGSVAGAWPTDSTLVLDAASPGTWGNALSATVDTNNINKQVATALGVADPASLFNLTVTYQEPNGSTQTEQFSNLTLDTSYPALFIGNVLPEQSQLVTYKSGTAVVAGSGGQGSGGRDSDPLSMTTYLGDQNQKTGLYALEQTPIFNILCIPPDDIGGDTPALIYQTAAEYCVDRHAMLIIDPLVKWEGEYAAGNIDSLSLNDLGSFGADAGRSSAIYFPRVLAADPLRNGQVRTFPNSGYMAGLWAQTDVQYGVWKAPAGLNAAINGIAGLPVVLSDTDNGVLNPIGINCLRTFPIGGSVVWGARTLRGADQLGDQYNYIPVRRLLLYLMDWTLQNTKWAVFQPNDESLWSGLRTQLSTMLNGLWKQGALFGASADQAYFVNCDASTTTQADIDAGKVNVQIGFAPVKPAEFVVVTLQQIAGQS